MRPLDARAKATAQRVNTFVAEAKRRLGDSTPANMLLLRGFDQLPTLPRFPVIFGLRSAAIAAYPMYRGLAKLVGMEVLKTGGTFAEEVATLREHWEAYDFFFLHYKDTDKAGEDGDFDAKVAALERLDAFVPAIRALKPDVLVVTGDHGNAERKIDVHTGETMTEHTANPVPFLLACDKLRRRKVGDGILADVAPTILDVMDVPKPEDMTGFTLLR